MAAGQTIRHRPDIGGVPINIQRELEYLRTAIYQLLDNDNAFRAQIANLKGLQGAQGPPGPPGSPVAAGGTVNSPQPGGGGTGAVTTLFRGQVVVLSPFPFLQNAISGQYMLNLYNFIQTVPGGWEYGCLQSNNTYTWPVVDMLPPSGIIPSDWGPYLIVGNRVLHPDFVCDR